MANSLTNNFVFCNFLENYGIYTKNVHEFDGNIVLNNDDFTCLSQVVPKNWVDDGTSSYFLEVEGHIFLVGFACYPKNSGFLVGVQDYLKLECTEARSVYCIPECSPESKSEDIACISEVYGIFMKYFKPFLMKVMQGETPIQKAWISNRHTIRRIE